MKGKSEFWSEKEDLGVFDIAEFKFLGPKSKFERNWRKRFSIFQIFKIEFWVRKLKIVIEFQVLRCWFFNFGDWFWIPIPKIENRNRISGFDVPISQFPETKFSKNQKFQILTESVSAFSFHFDQNFQFCRVYIPKSSSHLAK